MILKDSNVIAFAAGTFFLLVGIIVIVEPDLFTNQPPFWLGFVFMLFGGGMVVGGKIITVYLDKSANKLIFVQKGLSGRKRKEYDLSQIKEVELSVAYNAASKSKGGGHSYHVAFVCKSGEIIQLNPGHASVRRFMGRQIIPEKILGVRIAAFLGVPFQERRPPTVQETLSAVTSAIQNVAEQEVTQRKTL